MDARTSTAGIGVENRKLQVNEQETETVRHIFRRYLAVKSVRELQVELAISSITSKRVVRADRKVEGGNAFSRGALYTILKNQIYSGLITHKGNSYAGEH